MIEESKNHISGFSRAAARADKRFSRHERENRFLVKRSEDFKVMDIMNLDKFFNKRGIETIDPLIAQQIIIGGFAD